uniref:caspase, EACC1-associated type n=1 Tax=Amycolatopsis sp. CA-096443 TaxID=3239919 RepID=UPI003F494ECB
MAADVAAPDRSGSTAVVVGVSAYRDPAYQDPGLGRLAAAANSLALTRRLLADPALCGWPADRIETISDPVSPADLAVRLRDIARRTTGTLLLYYVGHGEITATGELVLTVAASRADAPKETGLRFDLVRDAFNASPARTKIAILDCCGAGRAIPTVLGPAALAARARVEGTHIVTAATGNSDAHRPSAVVDHAAPTSFTAALADVLRRGMDGMPQWLTLADVFPVLAAHLLERGLPAPGQAISSTASQAPFARNAAVADTGGEHPAPSRLAAVPTTAAPVPCSLGLPGNLGFWGYSAVGGLALTAMAAAATEPSTVLGRSAPASVGDQLLAPQLGLGVAAAAVAVVLGRASLRLGRGFSPGRFFGAGLAAMILGGGAPGLVGQPLRASPASPAWTAVALFVSLSLVYTGTGVVVVHCLARAAGVGDRGAAPAGLSAWLLLGALQVLVGTAQALGWGRIWFSDGTGSAEPVLAIAAALGFLAFTRPPARLSAGVMATVLAGAWLLCESTHMPLDLGTAGSPGVFAAAAAAVFAVYAAARRLVRAKPRSK